MRCSCLLALAVIVAACSPGLRADAVTRVTSVPALGETRRTLDLAPGSAVPAPVALGAAQRIARYVSGTTVYSVAATGSMRPLFDGNALLLTEPAEFDRIAIGDIVMFKHPKGSVIVHRVMERRGKGFWTKGDHNPRPDDVLVTPENYLGRVYGILYTDRRASPLASGDARRDPARAVAANR